MIIVSGLPRSGTSMMMQVLKAGGRAVLEGYKRPPDEHNPKGYFEVAGISERINECTQTSYAIKLVSPYLHKREDFRNVIIIFMERNFEEILASQEKMMGKSATKAEREALIHHLIDIKIFLADKQVIYIDYNETIKNPRKELEKIKHLVTDFDAAVKMVDEKLYKTRRCSYDTKEGKESREARRIT